MRKYGDLGLKGICKASLSSCCPESFLNTCNMAGLELWHVDRPDAICIEFYFYEKDAGQIGVIAEKCMCRLSYETLSGGSHRRRFLKAHAGLAATLLGVFALLVLSSMFIWDLEVLGNERLSEGSILRALAHCGVDRGSFSPGIDRELLRSEMLMELPELAWMTVNIRGSRAQVLVLERQDKPEIYMESRCADLVAAKTGIVKSIFARNGKVLVREGSGVIKGETLVSGSMDSITAQPRRVRSQGEVMAETWYEICSVAPEKLPVKTEKKRPKLRIAIKFGQKRFNFYLGGRKTVDGYDKIVDNYIVGVKDVFSLPLCLVVERIFPYDTVLTSCADTASMALRLSACLEESIDGELLSSGTSASVKNGLALVSLRAACLENIAQLSESGVLDDTMP